MSVQVETKVHQAPPRTCSQAGCDRPAKMSDAAVRASDYRCVECRAAMLRRSRERGPWREHLARIDVPDLCFDCCNKRVVVTSSITVEGQSVSVGYCLACWKREQRQAG